MGKSKNTKQSALARQLAAQNPGMKHTEALRAVRQQWEQDQQGAQDRAVQHRAAQPWLSDRTLLEQLERTGELWHRDRLECLTVLERTVGRLSTSTGDRERVWPGSPGRVLYGACLAVLVSGRRLDRWSLAGALAALEQDPAALLGMVDSAGSVSEDPRTDVTVRQTADDLADALLDAAGAEKMTVSLVAGAVRDLLGPAGPGRVRAVTLDGG